MVSRASHTEISEISIEKYHYTGRLRVKVTNTVFNSRADSESKNLYTYVYNSQRFRTYDFLKYSK
jgi:hypothetical protein